MPRLILLGTAGYHPSERRHTSCAMLPHEGIILDAGTGMFRVRDHLVTDTIDIFLTHSHLDHTVGLTFLFDVILGRELKRITVHAAAEKLAAIEEHLFSHHLFPVAQPFDTRPLGSVPVQLESCVVRAFPLKHPGGCLGFRFDWEHCSMALVTDTMATRDAPYLEHIRNLDLLIHECFFTDSSEALAGKTGHSCAGAVGEVARQVNPKRIVLTHFNPLDNLEPPIDLTQIDFPHVEIGEDGMEIEF